MVSDGRLGVWGSFVATLVFSNSVYCLHLFSLIVTARVEVSKSILPLVMNGDNGVRIWLSDNLA